MATPSTNFGTLISLVDEVTPGTEVARVNAWRPMSVDLEAGKELVIVPTFAGDANTAVATNDIETLRGTLTGSFKVPWSYTYMVKLWKLALGGCTTTGTGPFTHTCKPTRTLGSASIEVQRGSSSNAEEGYGVKVNRLTAEVAAGGIATITVELLGMQGANTRGSGTSLTVPTLLRAIGPHAGQLGYNGNNFTLIGAKLVIDNKLARVDECGSIYSTEPERTAPPSYTLEVELYSRNNTLWTEHLAGTKASATLTLSNGTESCAITLYNACMLERPTTTLETGDARIKTRAVFTGSWDPTGTNYGVRVVTTNSNSNATELA